MDVFPFKVNIYFKDGNLKREDDKLFADLNCSSQKEVLIFGLPGFGRTLLCQMMALHWALRFSEMEQFGLCICCLLPSMRYGQDFSMEIVNFCNLVLGKHKVDLSTLQDVLKEYSGEIVLLLDGFDHLSAGEQTEVLNFVKLKPIFVKSTIVVTTGPAANNRPLINKCGRMINIEGCSSGQVIDYLRRMNVETDFIRHLHKKLDTKNLDLLCELSPFFAAWIAQAVRRRYRNLALFDSVYSLLSITVEEMIADRHDSRKWTEPLLIFGRMCFDNLVLGSHAFDERALLDAFGDLQFLLDCRFLYKRIERNKNKNVSWTITSKVLQVFFATMYLRETWSTCEDQEMFLKEVYCCNGCSGDYVIVPPDQVYYVGLIPEIVLKMELGLNLKDAKFQMYYDVDGIEKNQAFDSVNLLLRIEDKFLARFRFEPVEDTALKGHFAFLDDLLNTSLGNFFFEHHFYRNIQEEKFFVKWRLQDVEKMEDALFVVLREKENFLVDRLYLDFSFSRLFDLFEFIEKVLSRFLEPINLYGDMKCQSFEDFVINILQVFLKCSVLRTAVVSCKSKACEVDSFIFQVLCSNLQLPGTRNEKLVAVAREKFCSFSNLFHNSYNEHEFYMNKGILQEQLTKMKESSKDIRISIFIW